MWECDHTYLIPTPKSHRVPNRAQQAQFQAAVQRSLDAAAARSTDPVAFKVAWARYKPVFDQHFAELEDAAGELTDGEGWFVDRFWGLYDEAKARTIREGYADPHETYRPAPPPEPEVEADPLDALKRAAMRHASLPRATLADIEDSRVVHGESATYEFIRAEQRAPSAPAPEPGVDKLDGFRGIGPLNYPAAYPDS